MFFSYINGRLLPHLLTTNPLLSITSAEQHANVSETTRFNAFKKRPRPSGQGSQTFPDKTRHWSPYCKSIWNWTNVWTSCFCRWFYKKASTSRKNLACCLSAQQQQPVFWACCPVPGLGGVIRPSAPHQHERFMFILDQSVCLFLKGFDHSTPWPPGSSYPPAEVIRFTLSHAKLRISSVFMFSIVPPTLFPSLVFSLVLPVWTSVPLLSHFTA